MKIIVFLFSFLLISTSLYSEKINSYNIDVKFDKTKRQLFIEALIDLQHENVKETKLLLSSKCIISSITDTDKGEIQYVITGQDTIVLLLNESLFSSSNALIKFTYCYPVDEDTVILIDRGNRWYPMIAENIAHFTIKIEVPQNYVAVFAGELLAEENNTLKKYTFSSYIPVFKIPIIIAPENYYSVSQSSCGNLKTYVYYIPNNNENSIDSMQKDLCNLINYFSHNFGNYPFNRFNLVETSAFEGANFGSSIITAGTGNIKAFSSGYKEWLHLAVASQWVGAGVFPKLFCKGFWFMSLSIPHYLRLMYLKDTEGDEAFNKEIQNLSAKYNEFAGSESDIPIFEIDYPSTSEKGILIYGKGVLILDELRKQLGENNCRVLLRYLYENYHGKIIVMDDFVNCIDKFDPTGKCSSYLIKMLSEKGSLN